MFERIWEWLKGKTYVTEKSVDMVTLTGIIPAVGRWKEEPYRIHVWTVISTTTRDAFWVSPVIHTRFIVEPLTDHQIPVSRRGRTIHVTEPMERYEPRMAVSMSQAGDAFVLHVVRLRWIYEEARTTDDQS